MDERQFARAMLGAGIARAIEVIDEHIPSLSNENDDEIVALAYWGEELVEAADLAIRTCHCGVRIDGFYEYVDHLKEVLRGTEI